MKNKHIKEGVLKRRRLTCGLLLSKNKTNPIIEEDYITMEHPISSAWHLHYVTATGAHNGYYQIKDGSFVVAQLHDYFDIEKGAIIKKEEQANLAVAAPKLLDALEELLFLMDKDAFGGSLEDAKANARAATLEARGQA